MEICGNSFPELISVKRVQVKRKRLSGELLLVKEMDYCIVISHTEGDAWIKKEGGDLPLMIEQPCFVKSKKFMDKFSIEVDSIKDNNEKYMRFTLVFLSPL